MKIRALVTSQCFILRITLIAGAIKILSQFQRFENIDIKTWYGFILWEKFFNK